MSRSSERYWLDRCKELERLTDQGCRVTAAELAKLYEQALASIRERIRRLYRRFAEGYGVTPREAQELLSAAQTKQEREILRRMLEECDDPDLRAEILKKLDAPAYGYRISRLEALQDQVYFDAKAVGVKEVQYDRGRLLDTYKTAYYRTTFNLSQSVGYNVPFERISDRRAARAIEQYWTPDPESLGQNFSQRVWNNTTELAENVREIVTEGLLTGGNYKDMADRLQAQMGDVSAQKVIQPDGSARTVLTGSGAKYRATRLIRTEGNHITGQAVLESYEDAGIEKYIYRSLLELRTCKRCGKLDGKRFPVKEQQVGVNMHPMHPNCRCFVVPDEPDEDLKDFTRSAQTGADNWEEVPANMSWEEWRKKYVDGNPQMKGAARPKKKGEKAQEPLAKSGESGILKEIGLERVPVTQEAIDSVPSARVSWWNDEMAERVKEAHKNLLESVKDKKVGAEEARILSMDGTVMKSYPEVGAALENDRVKVPDQPFDYILLHNHPDCGPFSPADLNKFILRERLRGLTAIGHNGRVFGIVKGTNYDADSVTRFYWANRQRLEESVKNGDSDKYFEVLNLILEEAEKYGAEFIR